MGTWLIWLLAALCLYIAQLGVILWLEHRKPAQLTAWLFIAFVCPIIGFVAYVFLGSEFTRRKRIDRYRLEAMEAAIGRSDQVREAGNAGNPQLAEQEKLFAMLTALAPFPITARNRTKVLTNGKETFEAILLALEGARHHIHLDYYTIRDDGIGRRFQELLVRKARDGVQVRVIYDGIGSMNLSDAYVEKLRSAGVQTSCFLPPRLAFFDRRLNFRNHRKIVVVDGLVGFIGGINIGDEYLGKDPKLGFWRDTHLRLEGDAVYFLQELFLNDWAFAAKKKLEGEAYMPAHRCEGGERVQIVSSKPGHNDQQIRDVLFAAITAARSRIYVTTPYFIPDPSLMTALRTAALSGVDVRLVIPGRSDSRLVLLATLSYIQAMLEAGVKVYRYEKGFVHAKVMIVDEMLATLGTANVDMRSLYSNFEINAVLFDEAAIRRLERDFMDDLANSRELSPEAFKRRPRRQKTAESIVHILSPLL
ncbi:cardiolipin synthase [Paenibacillus arenilitoris]|uniref:Cardiolipin synthase n=1 Tax=Paenibacillus arenilitoris TaxID=2772299 RepID=A0A927CH32_9BACL|nr:cardiolipin synthase [Paenibacillus arenilitoris]MBD2867973.1 cardiolipin synthase [Paenibacillus arenilitoris]